jgi:hypothetical protein
MSELTLFVIGAVVFAITVYGSVMGAGIALSRSTEEEEPLSPGA